MVTVITVSKKYFSGKEEKREREREREKKERVASHEEYNEIHTT